MSTKDESLKPAVNEKRQVFGWTMYDWANSAFATTIMAAVLPVYYSSVAANTLEPNVATAYWGYTTTAALLLVSLLAPVLGALADARGAKKASLVVFALLGIIGTALLYLVQSGDWILASLLFIIGSVGFSGSLVFYDSLLPHIAGPDKIDQVSARGYAMGYLGGGLLLAINLGMIMLSPENLTGLMTRLTFVSVAGWWLVFSIPLLLWVPEPARKQLLAGEAEMNPITVAFRRLGNTFRKIRQYKELLKFIIAFWFYNNGIGTIIYMATIYGAELNFGQTTLIGTLLMVQFVAIPFAILFGWLAKKMGTRNAIYLSLGIYTVIAIGGYFMYEEIHFWLLGFAVATVQGGSQALSRSLCGRMMPKSQSAEFYSFFGVSEKIAGIVGPFLFGTVSLLMGHSRLSIVSLIIFFIIGGFLLSRVNVEQGIRVAEVEEQALSN
jgi:UMF1 family MFS transporter